jgi:hypothetical protein
MFQTKAVKKIKTHFILNNVFRKPCRLRDNVEKYGTAGQATDDGIIRRMRFSCWITKATDTLGICNTYCFSMATILTRTYLNVTLYVHCLSCFLPSSYMYRKVVTEDSNPPHTLYYKRRPLNTTLVQVH